MELKVTVDVSEALAGLDDLQKRQIPFALAKTLTGCAKAGQRAVQKSLDKNLGGKFDLRNKFTQRGIRINPAEKNGAVIEADVHTDTANRSSGAPDYLLAQDTGAEKTPYGGHSYIAVPTRYFRQKFGNGVIRAELRPKNLLGAVGGRFTTITRRKHQIALKNQRIVAGYVFFIQDMKDGHKAIMGRDADGHDPEPFYFLISEAKIRPVLEMEKTVDAAVQKAFPELWQETWRSIMARGLKIQG